MFNCQKKISEFRMVNPFEQRVAEHQMLKDKYPNNVQVILQSDTITLIKTKYLIPNDLTTGQFLYFLRRKLTLRPEQAVFLFIEVIDDKERKVSSFLPRGGETVGEIYTNNYHTDGYLYIFIENESTFG